MLERNNYTMQKVETMVCECVSSIMTEENREQVSCDDVYKGTTNIPFGRIVARNFILEVLHNKYGFSYSALAQRSNMQVTSVMRCVKKCIDFMLYDNIYKRVNMKIELKLREWYGKTE